MGLFSTKSSSNAEYSYETNYTDKSQAATDNARIAGGDYVDNKAGVYAAAGSNVTVTDGGAIEAMKQSVISGNILADSALDHMEDTAVFAINGNVGVSTAALASNVEAIKSALGTVKGATDSALSFAANANHDSLAFALEANEQNATALENAAGDFSDLVNSQNAFTMDLVNASYDNTRTDDAKTSEVILKSAVIGAGLYFLSKAI